MGPVLAFFDPFFKILYRATKSFAKLRELVRAEKDQDDQKDNQQFGQSQTS